jgi:hypothetical protein
MQTLTRTEFFAKPEVKEALKKLKTAAREALPATSFAQPEEAMLAIFEEAQRGLVEEELQCLSDGFGELLLVDGVEYKQHEPGLVEYSCLGHDSGASVQLPSRRRPQRADGRAAGACGRVGGGRDARARVQRAPRLRAARYAPAW